MKKLLPNTWMLAALAASFLAFTRPALSAPEEGTAAFTTEGRTYLGQYTVADRALSVEIDGLLYKGHYTAHAEDSSHAAQNAPASGQWGGAFLFASSAAVLRCRLDTHLPQVSGLCDAADGRRFELTMPAKP